MEKNKARSIQSICIFCGSATGENPVYADETIKFGRFLARKNIAILFGGGKVGLMGALANGSLEFGGKVIGVIPDFLVHEEIAHDLISEMHVVQSMSERKDYLMEKSDAFVALPGGFGTLDELFEVLTACQLDRIRKPVAILNTNGYFDQLLSFLNFMVGERFLRPIYLDQLIVADTIEELFLRLQNHQPTKPDEWRKKINC